MNRTLCALSFVILFAGFAAVPRAAAQNVTINLGRKVIIIPPKEVEKFKSMVAPLTLLRPPSNKPRNPYYRRRRGKSGGKRPTKSYEGRARYYPRGITGDNLLYVPSMQTVKRLANEFKLAEKPKKNPQLAFGPDEIEYWYDEELSSMELKLRFAAIRTVLDAAESQNVAIPDHETLFEAADEFVRIATEQKSSAAGDITSPNQKQSPDVSALLCEGDTSEALIRQAWESLDAGKGGLGVEKLEKALACTKVAIDTFAAQADEQQARRVQGGECKVPPGVNDKESYFRLNAALSDIGAAWFIRGQVFSQQQKWKEAREAYKVVVDKYSCAYAWDPRGWFWRIAEGAERESKKLP